MSCCAGAKQGVTSSSAGLNTWDGLPVGSADSVRLRVEPGGEIACM